MAMISLQTAYDQARRWIESNDSERAISLAQHILEQYPKNLEAYRILGEAYLASRQLDKAQGAFEQVLRSDPENIPAHVGLGITFERQGRIDKAVPEFEQAWEIKPDMTELRSQLLRLYTDAWGSEHAQLRLSRAGLARLYAKGHMLPQAIAEFRHVIADNPNRYDTKVALAEALWRDGQEDAVVAMAHDLLNEHPDLLKADLLLGYIALAGGQADGQQYWDAARAMDPYQTVAQAMFDTLPSDAEPEPMIAEWDEDAWLRKQRETREQEELAAATRPMPVTAAVTAPAEEEDTFGSWFEQTTLPPPPQPRATPAHADDEDDFLAGLLGMGSTTPAIPASTPSTPATAETTELDDLQVQPFDFDTVEPAATPSTPIEPPTSAAPADEPQMTPFSLADLGLDDDDIASFNSVESPPAQPSAPANTSDEPQMTPFSLADLGLDEDEIASLNSVESPPAQPRAPANTSDEPQMTPFSLADLGLDEDEIASLNSVGSTPAQPSAPATTSDEPQMTPFSLADLGLTDDDIASLNEAGDTASDQSTTSSASSDEPQMTPFSLADLGLTDDEIASFESLSETGDTTSSRTNTPAQANAPTSGGAPADTSDFDELPEGLLPFSLDELDLSSSPDSESSGLSGLPASLQPFSIEETSDTSRPSNRPSEDTFARLNLHVPDEDDSPAPTGGYSFREPNQRSRPGFLKPESSEPADDGLSIFAKLRQRKQNEPAAPPEELAPVSDAEIDPMLFSLDDVSLRDETSESTTSSSPTSSITPPLSPPPLIIPNDTSPSVPPSTPAEPPRRVEAEDINEALSSGQIQPFSLADLGLSDDEIAALGFGTTQTSAPSVETTPEPSATLPAEPEQATPAAEQSQPVQSGNVGDALSLDEVQPFSFADLGLSDDEIASFGLGEPSESTPAAEEPSTQTSTPSTSFGESDTLSDAVESGEVQPFSFADLGLSDDEIASFGLDEGSAGSASQQTEPTSSTESQQPEASVFDEDEALTTEDLQPFSLTDLGLSDEEIGAFNSAYNEPSSAGLGITEEDLAGLDLGDMNWNQTPPASTSDQSFAEADVEPEPEGDPVVERLIALGQRQGYVDVNDIITGVDTPEAEEERIEEIINQLQAANIEIRDGDERIDLSADEEEYEDDLASIDFGEPAPAVPSQPPANDEPDMTPFSLADLGLSDEEISALNLGESTAEAAPAASTVSDEPEMTPFSLADLGLSDEEISALNLDDPTTETAPADQATSDEPEMTPFSLADLGLSDDEISALNLDDPTTEAAPAAPTASDEPEMTPFSLADLGLSDEEISALNLDEPTAEAAPAAPATSDEPEMTPFSLAELGLSDEEISALNLDEPTTEVAPAAPTANDEPEMTPFSLADLGLSDEEINAISAGDPASAPAVTPPPASSEPDTTPFSLDDLGLADEEPALTSTFTPSEPEPSAPAPVEAAPSRAAEPPATPAIAPTTSIATPVASTGAATQPARAVTNPPLTNNPAIDTYIQRLEADPQNHVLRLAVARLVGQAGMASLAIQQYRQLIRQNALLDNVISELSDLLEEVDEPQMLQRVHRTLGDAYSKQGRIEQAIEEYSWLP